MPSGGKRTGAGRKPADPSGVKRARVWFFLTPAEAESIREFLAKLRTQPVAKSAPPPVADTPPTPTPTKLSRLQPYTPPKRKSKPSKETK